MPGFRPVLLRPAMGIRDGLSIHPSPKNASKTRQELYVQRKWQGRPVTLQSNALSVARKLVSFFSHHQLPCDGECGRMTKESVVTKLDRGGGEMRYCSTILFGCAITEGHDHRSSVQWHGSGVVSAAPQSLGAWVMHILSQWYVSKPINYCHVLIALWAS